MHIKLHISLSGHNSTPITVKSINKTLRGELINTVINCSNSSNNIFFFSSQHKCFNTDTFIDRIKDKFLFQSGRKINNPPEAIIKSSGQIHCGAKSATL